MKSANLTAGKVQISGLWWKALVGIWMCVAILMAFLRIGPAEGFTMNGHGSKVLFFHVPCAWLATIAYVVAACYAVRVVRRAEPGRNNAREADVKCAAAMELGFLFSILTTITGSIFAHNEWHSYWNWDPRETSIVILLLIFAAYLVLRGGIIDPVTRGRLSSAYVLISVVPGLFLIWVVPRIIEWTKHPNQAVIGGGLSGNFRLVLYCFAMPAFIGTFILLFQLKVRLENLIHRRIVVPS
jgi:heme exporter protein C